MSRQVILEWITDNKGKTIALVISCLSLAIIFLFGQQGDWIRVLIFLILPLACIFFSEAMGNYTGISQIGVAPHITKITPAFFVALAGWFLLLFVLAFTIFRTVLNKG